ncbi:hypothetical protein [Aggregatibacter actinomycetemcomitans]|uniref:hypothetical protein n=1 Tax=Aggregatibacter actinomycetemcomitans TaxID=714 RepID=UPI00077E4967|nr:hypothetical protein [Aggregatibacter actinomycetemcomitans]KYK82848.1 hypothetical protein SC936_00220 [Aggregatibacter actinomycetemcomitans serotype e str. SC936]TYA23461.1 hypothetical protein FXB91_04465 [Aggregatibacter actinomycetemcomitans]TYA47767.1 hypothetical protein FXB73_03130 [Aggregatibacter actinomycetemcomitans]
MNAQSFGHVFGMLFKRVEQRLTFIPPKLRKVVLVGLAIVGLPIFLVAFLALRAWIYRDIPLELNTNLSNELQPTDSSEDIFYSDDEDDGYNGFQLNGPEGPGHYANGYRVK